MKKPSHFEFTSLLLKWNREKNNRRMPWKGEKDPYKVWLSEIILQQTRVEQGLGYYNRFIKTFPSIIKLANASENKVYKLWEGLGYYNRCKNLISTARDIAQNRNGKFPDDFEKLKELKGIGPYTAAAISSFAFNKPHAVVDGNVFRLLARVFGIKKQIDSTEGKKFFSDLAAKLLDLTQPAIYNQAIMDLGATICKPQPDCPSCPFIKFCKAYQWGCIEQLPVKAKKSPVQKRWFSYVVVEYKGKLGIVQRKENEIWQNLFQFSLIETKSEKSDKYILSQAVQNKILNKNSFHLIDISPNYRQQLSHQTIYGKFYRIKLIDPPLNNKQLIWVTPSSLKNFPFPKLINQYLQDKNVKSRPFSR
jgi:A/G-specific adenine glycosylase